MDQEEIVPSASKDITKPPPRESDSVACCTLTVSGCANTFGAAFPAKPATNSVSMRNSAVVTNLKFKTFTEAISFRFT